MAWRGSISRTIASAARSPSLRSPPSSPLPRFRPPPTSAPRIHSRRFTNPRNLGELGCVQSLLPLAGARMTSRLDVNLRAFCELSHGTFCRSCQDR
nr:caspase-6 protein [Tanacetum cinerariifolium]